MRCFIGFGIPGSLKDRIEDIQNSFIDFDIKMVELDNLHFCLKFLGEVSEEQIEEIWKKLARVCQGIDKFTIKIQGVDAFPSKNLVKVLWLGVKDGKQQLAALGETVHSAIEVGDSKEFVPHLTLGRVKSGMNKNNLLVKVRNLEEIEIGEMEVNEIKIIKSELGRTGPVYEELFTISLK